METKMEKKGNKEIWYDEDGHVVKVRTIFTGTSRTIQDFRDEVDVNNIVERFMKTGQLPQSSQQMVEVDRYNMPVELQDAIEFLKTTDRQFEQLNSKLGNKFKTIQEFYDYVSDQKNYYTDDNSEVQQTTTIQTTTKKEPKSHPKNKKVTPEQYVQESSEAPE